MRQLLGSLVIGGEACIQFEPGVVDGGGVVTDESVCACLKAYIDRFGSLVAEVSGVPSETA